MIQATKIKKSELLPGDILVFSKTGFIARAIQILTRSKYNHTATIGSDGKIYEAVPEGYVRNSLKEALKDNPKQVIVKRPKYGIDVEKLDSAINDMKNAKYEFAGIGWQILHQLWGGWKGDKEVTKNTFCSKASAYIMYKMNYEDYSDYYKVSPDEIADDYVSFDTFDLILK